tara:strand:- start:489 stop:2612 length:2124 start_codon:yes stop_codon:yes gene_type:complete
MPLQKILFKPGVNKENTRYTTEGGWYEADKVRFRQGNPEVIGGWEPLSVLTYLGVCRSLWNWTSLGGSDLIGIGTNLKFYILQGTEYYDITPIRETVTINNNPFALTASTTVTVTDTSHGCVTGDFVTFSDAVDIGSGGTNVTAAVLNQEFQVTVLTANTYTIVISVTPNATAIAGSPGGGSSVVATYQVNVGAAIPVPLTGWGAGSWGQAGTSWGNSGTSTTALRLWNQINYGEDLLFGPRSSGIYYWVQDNGVGTRGVLLNTLGGTVSFTNATPTVVTSSIVYNEGAALQFNATSSMPTGIASATTYYAFNVNGNTFNLLDSAGNEMAASSTGSGVYVSLIVDVPVVQNNLTVSDTSRFIITFGCNDYGESELDPMLIRWSAQNDPYNWTPDATNQAGFVRISHGSEIVAAVQTRQEVFVLTDSAAYSLQYLGPPYVWAPQLLGDNISIMSPNSAVIASGIVYWMGVDKFYSYDGRVQTLNCDLRRYVFSDINQEQALQVFCGTNEGFNEVWWFYCSANSTAVDKYVIYNYLEKIWYYGTMERTAWLDSGLQPYPIAAKYTSSTATGVMLNHETGLNDNTTGTATAIDAYISSSEFDIGDGHNFGFVWRVLPDLSFENATNSPTAGAPQVTMTLYGLTNSGSGTTSSASGTVAKGSTYVITEEFTGQIMTRMRGRQMIFKISSNQVNTCWQLGAPRIDIRPDGRR